MAAYDEKPLQSLSVDQAAVGPPTPLRTNAEDSLIDITPSQLSFDPSINLANNDVVKAFLKQIQSPGAAAELQTNKMTSFRFVPSPNSGVATKTCQPTPAPVDDFSEEDVVIAAACPTGRSPIVPAADWLFPGALLEYHAQLFQSNTYFTDRDLICEYLEDLADDLNSWGRMPDPLDSSDHNAVPECSIKTSSLSPAALASVMNGLLNKGDKVMSRVEKLIEVQSEHAWRCVARNNSRVLDTCKQDVSNSAAQYETLMRECEKLRSWRKLLQLFKCIRKDWLEHADQDSLTVPTFDVQRLWVLVEGMCNRASVHHLVMSNQQQLCPACSCTYAKDQAYQAAHPPTTGSPASPYNKLRVAPPPAFHHHDNEHSPTRPPSFAVVTPRKDSELILAARMVTGSGQQNSSSTAKPNTRVASGTPAGLPKFSTNTTKALSKPKSRLGRAPGARTEHRTGAARAASAVVTQSAGSPDTQSGSPKSQSPQQESLSAAQTLSSSDSGVGQEPHFSPNLAVPSPTGSSIRHNSMQQTRPSSLVDTADFLSSQHTILPDTSRPGASAWPAMLSDSNNPYANGSPVLKRKFNSMAAPSFVASHASSLRDEPSLQLACELHPSSWVLDTSLTNALCTAGFTSSLIPVSQSQNNNTTLAPSKVRRLAHRHQSPNTSPPLTPPSAYTERAPLRFSMLPTDLGLFQGCDDQLLGGGSRHHDLPNLSLPLSSSPLPFTNQIRPEDQLLDGDALHDGSHFRSLLQFGSGPQGTLERMPSDVLITYRSQSSGLNSPVLDCTDLGSNPAQTLQSLLPLGSWLDPPHPLAFSGPSKDNSLHSGSLLDSGSQQPSQYSAPNTSMAPPYQDLHASLSKDGLIPPGMMMALGGPAALMQDVQGGSMGRGACREGSDGWGMANYLRLSREPSLNPVELMQIPDTSCFTFGAGHATVVADLPTMEDMIDSMGVRCSATRRRTTSCTQEHPSM